MVEAKSGRDYILLLSHLLIWELGKGHAANRRE
jgi:hypothetical protein